MVMSKMMIVVEMIIVIWVFWFKLEFWVLVWVLGDGKLIGGLFFFIVLGEVFVMIVDDDFVFFLVCVVRCVKERVVELFVGLKGRYSWLGNSFLLRISFIDSFCMKGEREDCLFLVFLW